MDPSRGYVFVEEDLVHSVYCIGCRTHIPKAVSNAGRGLCPVCIAKIQAPPPHQQQTPAPPILAPLVVNRPSNQSHQTPPVPSSPPPLQNSGAYAVSGGYQQVQPRQSKPMNPIVLTLIVCGIVSCCILTPIILASSSKEAEAERQRQAQRTAEAEKQEAARKSNDPTEIARREALAKRGPKPVPSAWDGITPEVRAYLRDNLKDYGSLKIVECSVIAPWENDAWCQRVKYRAKNSFGAYELEEQVFVIRDGEVQQVLGL